MVVLSCAMNILRCLLIKAALLVSPTMLSAQGVTSGKFDDEAVARYVKALEAKPSEQWRAIPRKLSLMEAQAEAAKVNKPLFIWAMDGHPLACV